MRSEFWEIMWANMTMRANLAISEGWKLMGPNCSHR